MNTIFSNTSMQSSKRVSAELMVAIFASCCVRSVGVCARLPEKPHSIPSHLLDVHLLDWHQLIHRLLDDDYFW